MLMSRAMIEIKAETTITVAVAAAVWGLPIKTSKSELTIELNNVLTAGRPVTKEARKATGKISKVVRM